MRCTGSYPRPARGNAHTARIAQSPRGFGREPVLRSSWCAPCRPRVGASTRPSAARPSDARGDLARAPGSAASAGTRVLAAAAALARPTRSNPGRLPGAGASVGGGHHRVSDGDVRFTHPLLASAAYMSIEAAEQWRLHRRLAEVVSDPEAGSASWRSAPSRAKRSQKPSTRLLAMRLRAALRLRRELAELAVRLTPATAGERLRGEGRGRQVSPSCRRPREERGDPRVPCGEVPAVLRGRTRCCSSRARNRASSDPSNSRNAPSSRLEVTTPVSRRSSAISARSFLFTVHQSRRSSTPERAWRPRSVRVSRTSWRFPSRPSPGSRR